MKATKIKHLVRTISANPSTSVGTDSAADVEHELAMYFDGGWELFYAGAISQMGANVSMLYILVKNELEPEVVPPAVKNVRASKAVG